VSSWSLAVTAPHREAAVGRMLRYWDLEHHCFKERRQIVHRGRIVERLYPIFPSYIFLQAQNYFDRVRDILGVIDFVRIGQDVVSINEQVIGELVDAADEEDVLPVPEVPTVSRFHVGDRVTIIGPSIMAGQQATFQRMLIGTQALVDLDWMGRAVPLCVDERDLTGMTITTDNRRRGGRRRRRQRNNRRHISPPL
jgi:transcription antitermination factor NusG